jgi:hypothetical protein
MLQLLNLKLYCLVLSPDVGGTLPSRGSKMFRIGERGHTK